MVAPKSEAEVILVAHRGTFDTKRARARELYDLGLSCNQIAKQLGCSPSTVSRWAKSEGLSFDRSKTAAAVEAHTIDLAEERVLLAKDLMVLARAEIAGLKRPYLVFNFGGKDNTYAEHTLQEAPMDVKRSVTMIAGVAFDKATRIVEKDNGGLDDAVGVIDALAGNMAAAAELLRARGETPTDGS